MKQIRFGIIGSGWRAAFYMRLAQSIPEQFAVSGVVTRTPERGQRLEETLGVATYRSAASMVAADLPDFVVVAVPRDIAPRIVTELVQMGTYVLLETPPAENITALRQLWSDVGTSNLVQVAEQYMFMPAHAARLNIVREGVLGDVSSCHISSTHLYHAVAMMRAFLRSGFSDALLTARSFTGPLADPVSRQGWTGGSAEKPARTTLASVELGGAAGFYDFTDNQWLNPLRMQRTVVRGSKGELMNDTVVHLSTPDTAIESTLQRRQTGVELSLEGHDLDHISFEGSVVYRNPFQGARLPDEEIAIATLLQQMGEWCSSGKGGGPYPLSEACQDHLIGLAIEEAVVTGDDIRTSRENWAIT